jgi:CheY-like chemotaxis protein
MEAIPGPLLVVEDMPNVLELLEVTLSFHGYTVMTARNGLEALDLVADRHPSLVISDILMPKMDGYTMAYKLRTQAATRHIPIVFLSATYVTPEDKAFALSLGAVRFLEKPVDTEEFLLTIGEILTSLPSAQPDPLSELQFYHGYRERLESKLRHKNAQISRTERLLLTVPASQKPAFETMLEEAYMHQKEIQLELSELFKLLNEQYN